MSPPARRPIFDNVDRVDPTPRRNGESSFRFLNRVSSEFWDQPRSLTQDWVDQIPNDSDYGELRSRLRSPDDHELRSAFLELYLHEVLRRTSREVVVHPNLPTGSRRPDFLARCDNGSVFVEAIAPSVSKEAKAAAARLDQFYAVTDELNDPNFVLWIDEISPGPEPVAASKVRQQLRNWLRGVVLETFDRSERPSFAWSEGDWSGTVSAWPKPQRGGDYEYVRGIGVYSGSVEMVNDAPTVHRALAEKDHAYGHLEAPFIIAIGMDNFDTDRDEICAALWGHVELVIDNPGTRAETSRYRRKPNGYFGVPGAWQHAQVSAVLVVNQLQQHNPTLADVSLWIHPGADHPVGEELLFPGDVIRLVGDSLETTAGLDANVLLELSADWPVGDPWPHKRQR